MRKEIQKIRSELRDWQELADVLKNEDLDAETLVDTLDGETELVEALCIVGEAIIEDGILIDGLSLAIKKLTERKSRFENSVETKRNIILQSMDIAAIPQIKGPLFTMSKKLSKGKNVIVDESKIPSQFWKTVDPVLDKKKINDSIKDGDTIEGVEKSNGGISLTIRIK